MEFDQTKKIAIVGDIILDEFVFGRTERKNPEADVPILDVDMREFKLGGAANVANNIVALGGNCALVSVIGDNNITKTLLNESGVKLHLVEDDSRISSVKIRYVANNEQLIRVDEESITDINDDQVAQLLGFLKDYDIIVVSDYAKGVVTEKLMDGIRKLEKTVLVDPKVTKPELFKDVFLIKPNLQETVDVLNVEITDENDIESAATKLQDEYNANILITRGKEGMSLFEKEEKPLHIPTEAVKVFDVTGAGDTVISIVALGLASGNNLKDAVILSNIGAGIAVGKVGTATLSGDELFKEIKKEHSKVKTKEEMLGVVRTLKTQGKKIVFTNGCFDILHIGHTRFLKKAKEFGDVLILGLNTDASVKRFKGESRPYVNEKERAEIMANLETVDYIVFFDEDDPSKVISEIKPDVHVKGGDYDPDDYENMPEAKVVKEYGGKVEILDMRISSTTDIVRRIKDSKE